MVLAAMTGLTFATSHAATSGWSYERDATMAFTFSYPQALFTRVEGNEKPSFHYFVSRDAEAKFLVGGWNNRIGQTPDSFKRWLITMREAMTR